MKPIKLIANAKDNPQVKKYLNAAKKGLKVENKNKKILLVIKRIRDSFHESVACYTQGRCYHFAKILQEIFGGELFLTNNKGHIVTKIGNNYYDIRGRADKVYVDENSKEWEKLTKETELETWDSNYHSGTMSAYVDRYNE